MDNVRMELSDNKMILYLSGRIDSNNAQDTEKEIIAFLDGAEDINAVVLDVKSLDYISSAGLRVLLHIKKRNNNLRIINAKSDVYDILDMTGFTQMINVEKAYREVSIEGCEVIGEGANGTLYRIDEDNVVKVYNNVDALEDIHNEREMAKIALILGIPTAISYDVVQVNGHYGSVFELLNARSFAKILATEPDKMDWCVREFTEMLNKIHSTVVPQGKLPDIRKTVYKWVDYIRDHIPYETYKKLQHMIREIPQDNHMIHGDYHVKNIMLQNDEVLLIDMDTLAVGHPVFELASIFNACIGFSEYDHDNVKNFLGIDFEKSKQFFYKVMAMYLATDDQEKIQKVVDKARIIGYLRILRRSLRRNDQSDADVIATQNLWRTELIELIDQVDSLLFYRDEITLEADQDKLDDVLRFVDQHLAVEECDPRTQMQIDVAVEEIYVNIASYAYQPAKGEVSIRIDILHDPRCARITFRDQGKAFDPLKRTDPDITLSAGERQIGGLGILMVKKTMDDVSYEYKDGQNIFSFIKYF